MVALNRDTHLVHNERIRGKVYMSTWYADREAEGRFVNKRAKYALGTSEVTKAQRRLGGAFGILMLLSQPQGHS
jgi:hypothetical protein